MDFQGKLCFEDVLLRVLQVPELFERVRGVRRQLADEDLLVHVEGVDDDVQELPNLGLEGVLVGGSRHMIQENEWKIGRVKMGTGAPSINPSDVPAHGQSPFAQVVRPEDLEKLGQCGCTEARECPWKDPSEHEDGGELVRSAPSQPFKAPYDMATAVPPLPYPPSPPGLPECGRSARCRVRQRL